MKATVVAETSLV